MSACRRFIRGCRGRAASTCVFEPDRIALAFGVLEQLENEAAALERQWKLRIERARCEAMRAQRQYKTCEPENRLVARNLEHFWEEKLRAVGK